jgi:transposase
MSTSLLYHGWGVRGYDHVAVFYEQGMIRFGIEQQPDTFRCSGCSSNEVMKSGVVTRRFRSLPIGGKAVWIELPIQRLWCSACGKTRQAKVAFGWCLNLK